MTSLAPIRSNPYITPASSKLLVSNLPRIFDEKAVRKMLKDYGKIKFLEMIRDPVTNESTGQCHVEYETEKATQDALHCKLDVLIIRSNGYKSYG